MENIKNWIAEALVEENFTNFEIKITGGLEKGDGYMSDIYFVEVCGMTAAFTEKVVHLVVKQNKDSELVRKKTPMSEAFKIEMLMYNKIFPLLESFQSKKKISQKFEAYPKCRKCLTLENQEIIIMEDLRPQGYEMYDRLVPLNLHHCKAVLKEFAKFHALSFALEDQNKESFQTLASKIDKNVINSLFHDDSFAKMYDDNFTSTMDRFRDDVDLYNAFRKLVPGSAKEKLLSVFESESPQNIITHSDGWNNNFLFRYKNSDKSAPSKVAILDWQLSAIRSPTYDVAFFLYCVCSKEQLDHFEELVDVYYTTLSSFITELGSDPDQLFTFEDFKTHWNKWALAAAIHTAFLMKYITCKGDNAPELKDLTEDSKVGDVLMVRVYDKDIYYERMKAVFEHYLESIEWN